MRNFRNWFDLIQKQIIFILTELLHVLDFKKYNLRFKTANCREPGLDQSPNQIMGFLTNMRKLDRKFMVEILCIEFFQIYSRFWGYIPRGYIFLSLCDLLVFIGWTRHWPLEVIGFYCPVLNGYYYRSWLNSCVPLISLRLKSL